MRPTRRTIYDYLLTRPIGATLDEVQQHLIGLGLPIGTTAYHLLALCNYGTPPLIEKVQMGRFVYYRLWQEKPDTPLPAPPSLPTPPPSANLRHVLFADATAGRVYQVAGPHNRKEAHWYARSGRKPARVFAESVIIANALTAPACPSCGRADAIFQSDPNQNRGYCRRCAMPLYWKLLQAS